MIRRQLPNIKNILTKTDIVLITILLLTVIFSYLKIRNLSSQKKVEIYFHNRLVKKTSLSQNQEIKISEGIIAEIKDGKVRMKESTCKKQYCVKEGWSDSFPIICVPNEVSIIIKSKKTKEKEKIIMTR